MFFNSYEVEVKKMIDVQFVLFVYEFVLKVGYMFNLFDVCGVILVIEWVVYIGCICVLLCFVVQVYYDLCEKFGFLMFGNLLGVLGFIIDVQDVVQLVWVLLFKVECKIDQV